MAAFKNLLIPYRVVVAGKKRKCYHNSKCSIVKGDTLIEVRAGQAWFGYCLSCAGAMVTNATDDLAKLSLEIAKGEAAS